MTAIVEENGANHEHLSEHHPALDGGSTRHPSGGCTKNDPPAKKKTPVNSTDKHLVKKPVVKSAAKPAAGDGIEAGLLQTLVQRTASVQAVGKAAPVKFSIMAPKDWKPGALTKTTVKWTNQLPRDYLGKVMVSWRSTATTKPEKMISTMKGLSGHTMVGSKTVGKTRIASFEHRQGGKLKRVKTLSWTNIDAKSYLACDMLYARYPQKVNRKEATALAEAICLSIKVLK